jgi:hypothetical protein
VKDIYIIFCFRYTACSFPRRSASSETILRRCEYAQYSLCKGISFINPSSDVYSRAERGSFWGLADEFSHANTEMMLTCVKAIDVQSLLHHHLIQVERSLHHQTCRESNAFRITQVIVRDDANLRSFCANYNSLIIAKRTSKDLRLL